MTAKSLCAAPQDIEQAWERPSAAFDFAAIWHALPFLARDQIFYRHGDPWPKPPSGQLADLWTLTTPRPGVGEGDSLYGTGYDPYWKTDNCHMRCSG